MIIGFSGYAGAGKDTAGEVLCEMGWERRAFADPLKAVARDLGWDGNKDELGRRFLQDLGVACRTHIDPDVWVRPVLREPPPRLVVTDVRYPNEASAIKSAGGTVVRILRTGVGPANDHDSESALDDWPFDLVIVNHDLDRFRATVRALFG